MGAKFIEVDRQTPMLLPMDMRDWVPEDDMVHFVISAVEGMRLTTLKVNGRGSGSAQYPPKMMLALLIYCYANGVFGSRRIERATYRDVAVRYLTGDTHPDHSSICAFRQQNFEAVDQAFLEVLKLAQAMKLLKVGTISVDGTHIAANASKNRNVRYDRAGELEVQLKLEIESRLKQAQEADASEREEGQKLPQEVATLEKLRDKMAAARATLESQAKARAQAEVAEYERKCHAHRERVAKIEAQHAQQQARANDVSLTQAQGSDDNHASGQDQAKDEDQGDGDGQAKVEASPRLPQPPTRPKAKAEPEPTQQSNLTDPDSNLMRKNHRSSYTQSYNCQAAVDADGSQLILAVAVTRQSNDAGLLIPMTQAVTQNVGPPQKVLADTGYASIETIEHFEMDPDQPEAFVAINRHSAGEQRTFDYRPPNDKPPPKVTHPSLVEMQTKLQSEEGRATYGKRKQTVEPVFGVIKEPMGFRRFLLRGLENVTGEWSLVALSYNMKRMWSLTQAMAT